LNKFYGWVNDQERKMNISSSFNTSHQLNKTQDAQNTQLQRISSGHRINSAKDDAAGLAISTGLESQGRSMQAAMRNSLDGTSRTQVEGGALASVTEDLQRIRELKVQQNNGMLNEQDKSALQSEIDQRTDSIHTVFSDTQFNQKNVFEQGSLNFQTGANAGQTTELKTLDMAESFKQLGLEAAADFSLADVDEALAQVTSRQSELGAIENRLSSNVEFLELKHENNQAANSRIKDTDIAHAASEKTKADIMQQVQISVQSQANASSKYVLNLLES
jgi:flagellin